MNRAGAKMLRARELLAQHPTLTAQRAAALVGLTPSAITRDASCQALLALRQLNGSRPQDRARRLVVEGGKTAYEAARITGLSQSSISRAKWYREFKEGKNHE